MDAAARRKFAIPSLPAWAACIHVARFVPVVCAFDGVPGVPGSGSSAGAVQCGAHKAQTEGRGHAGGGAARRGAAPQPATAPACGVAAEPRPAGRRPGFGSGRARKFWHDSRNGSSQEAGRRPVSWARGGHGHLKGTLYQCNGAGSESDTRRAGCSKRDTCRCAVAKRARPHLFSHKRGSSSSKPTTQHLSTPPHCSWAC